MNTLLIDLLSDPDHDTAVEAVNTIERLLAETVAGDIRIENDRLRIDNIVKALFTTTEIMHGIEDNRGTLLIHADKLKTERDALQARLTDLGGVDRRNLDLIAHNQELQAKYTEACQHVVKVECDHGTTLGELAELRAKLTALEKQEPVAWVHVVDQNDGPYNFFQQELLDSGHHNLYAASGAAPVPKVNFFDAQRIASEYGLEYNKFCAAHEAMLAAGAAPND